MTLTEALHILCEAHTRDDDKIGFTVSPGAIAHYMPRNVEKYIEAWKVARDNVGLQVLPRQAP